MPARAQDDAARAAAKKYSTEPALMSENSEHLRLRYEDGELVGRSTVTREMLLLRDAPQYNSMTFYRSYFHTLEGEPEARTYVPDGRGGYKSLRAQDFKTTGSSSESVFYDDNQQTTVTFPGIVAGARTRLEYTVRHKDLHLLTSFRPASGVPVLRATFRVTAPKNVVMGFVVRGDAAGRIKRTVEEGRNETVYTFEATDLPKLQGYADGPGLTYYMPQIITYVKSYQPPGASAPVAFLGTTADLYRYYYGFIRDVNNKPEPAVKALADSLTRGITAPRDKASRIYRWVQENIRYVAFEDGMGGFVPREAGAVCARRYGDCKDMTSLLVSLCQAAGLDAHFTWIGTRHLPYSYDETPLPLADNHMICAVKLDGKWVFLDGTDADIPFGIPPAGIQGKEALIGIGPKDFTVIKVPEAEAAQNTTVDSTHLRVAGGKLDGTVHISYTGYGASDLTGRLRYNNPDERERTFRTLASRGSNKYVQKAFDYKAAAPGKPFTVQSHFELTDYARALDKELYVNLNLQRTYEDDYVDVNTRAVPIEREYKERLRQVAVLDIPKGYRVTYLPPTRRVEVPGLWSYSIRYEATAGQVRLIKEFENSTLMIRPEQFAEHNRLVESLRKEYKESIVLTAL